MSKKRSNRPHGHYCKICGEYKANEKFSGKGHAAHICKTRSRLSAAEKAEAMTINRLLDFPMGRLSASDKKWLENRVHDRRPEVASLAREVYGMRSPFAEHNEKKKRLLINTLVFELDNVTVSDEFGDEYAIHVRFTADRLTNVLTMTNIDDGGTEQAVVLEKKQMGKLLRWVIHTLEIFVWEEDYQLGPDTPFADIPDLDLLPEYWPDGEDDDWPEDDAPEQEESEPEADVYWRVKIEYADGAEQEIVSYQDNLFDKPDELFFALREYFQPETDDFPEDFEEEELL